MTVTFGQPLTLGALAKKKILQGPMPSKNMYFVWIHQPHLPALPFNLARAQNPMFSKYLQIVSNGEKISKNINRASTSPTFSILYFFAFFLKKVCPKNEQKRTDVLPGFNPLILLLSSTLTVCGLLLGPFGAEMPVQKSTSCQPCQGLPSVTEIRRQ